MLRSIYQREGESWLQAGAGIVGQSRPARELEETNEKLACILSTWCSNRPPSANHWRVSDEHFSCL
ncbi:chorismate-binding protein [Pseudomonas aeruginosa]|nr:chorismate-binding protein [Pseudomonas aeruginosa]